MSRLVFSLAFLVFFIILDIYSYQAFRTIAGDRQWVKYAYWIFHGLVYAGVATMMILFFVRGPVMRTAGSVFFSLILALYVPKMILVSILIMEDVFRLMAFTAQWLFPPKDVSVDAGAIQISRSTFISQAAIVMAGIPFAGMVYGILKGKYDYKIHRVKLPIPDLPAAFEGLRITQISDLHTGSFDNMDAVKCGIDLVNEQGSDLIFFTGDIVNSQASELEGYDEIYSSLKAPLGVFSVLGNHDYYGDPGRHSGTGERPNLKKITELQASYGWQLLRNENHIIRRGEDALAIIGVENWSAKPQFPKYGDLSKAAAGTEDARVKLLLSHDPSHWEAEVTKDFKDINATFSGHTHGFQFGVEIPGFVKWSPVQYVYKQWADLYREGQQLLYVNRGFGFIGFSGRVGIRPEITVFELSRA
jgi:predicted MPP superfamily phosphohydrolase